MLASTKWYFFIQALFTCYLHRSWLQSPKTLEKAFHPKLSTSVTTTFISKLGLEHLSFIAWKKGINTSSSSLLLMRWTTGYPLLNLSGTTVFINKNLYWFVLGVASMHSTLCTCFSNIFNCSFVGNPDANMLFFKSISSYIFGPISVLSLEAYILKSY